MKTNITAACPEEGTCRVNIFEKKAIAWHTDEIGQNYYRLIDDPSKTVYQYEYVVAGPEGTADGELREEIVFELSSQTQDYTLENEALSAINLIYGRHCFCRGQAGTIAIDNGTFEVIHTKNQRNIRIQFHQEAFPQAFKEIEFIVGWDGK